MNSTVASSFTIVLTLAMMLSANPVMMMSSNIFASPSDDAGGGGSDDAGGGGSDGDDGSSENEQPEEESEPEVTEEEEEETKPELVNCPDGSQAATTDECPTGAAPTAPTGLVNCPDGSQAATTDECPTGASIPPLETPNILFGDYFYTDPCKTNPNDPLCKTPITSSTTTPGAPSGSLPAGSGTDNNDFCRTVPEAPFCKSQPTTGTTTDVPPASLLLPYFEADLDKDETTLFSVNNPVCQTNQADPACESTTITGTTTPGAPSGSIPADSGSVKNNICTTSPDTPFCKASTTTGTTTFEETTKNAESRFSVGFDAICLDSSPTDPACKESTTTGTTTNPATTTTPPESSPINLCQVFTTTDPDCNKTSSTEPTTPTDGTFYCRYNPTSPECNKTQATPTEVEVPKNTDGTCPAGSHIVGFGGKTGSNAPSGSKCISDNPAAKTTTTPATTTREPISTNFGWLYLCASTPTPPECNKTQATPTEVEVPKNTDGTCPAGSHIVGFGGKTGSNAPSGSKCVSDNPSSKTTTTPGTTTTPAQTTTPGTTTTPDPTAPTLKEVYVKGFKESCSIEPKSEICTSGPHLSASVQGEMVGYCQNTPKEPGCKAVNAEVARLQALPVQGEVAKPGPNGECPPGSHIAAFGGKAGSVGPTGARCISDDPPTQTPAKTTTTTTPATTTTTTPATTTTTTPATTTTTTPGTTPTTTKTVIVTKTNINNDQVTVRNDGGLTVQKLDGAVTPTADCPPQSATVVLGPSPMENGKARVLAAFDPCILTSGKVLLNLPDEKGIQLVGAKIQDGQTIQSTIVPIQRIAPTSPGQAQYFTDLTEQSTGLDLVSGNPVNLGGGNVNALLLMNLGGENVQLGADNKVNMDAALTKAAATTGTQPPTLASQPPAGVGGG